MDSRECILDYNLVLLSTQIPVRLFAKILFYHSELGMAAWKALKAKLDEQGQLLSNNSPTQLRLKTYRFMERQEISSDGDEEHETGV